MNALPPAPPQRSPARRLPARRPPARRWPAGPLAAGLLALCAAAAAETRGREPADWAEPPTVPGLTLAAPPRPTMPPAETGPVIAAQVERWRREAEAMEHGDVGVPRDAAGAARLYCRAARYGDAASQFALGWMLAHGRGIERNDAQAAHLFAAAAEQGLVQAQNIAARMGAPLGPPPPCLQPLEPELQPLAAQGAGAAPAPAPAGPRAAGGRAQILGGFVTLPPPARAPEAIVRYVQLAAPEFQLSPTLVLAVIATESNFDPLAQSPKNAQGLMQLIPDTAARFNVRRITDPVQNMRGGMAYLRWLLAYFEGDVALALAAYNAGEGAVDRWRGVPPYTETRNYVRRIMASIGGQRRHPFDPKVTAPSPVLALLRASGASGAPGAALQR